MRERNLRVLEFTKIRERLAGYALTDLGKEKCLASGVCFFRREKPVAFRYGGCSGKQYCSHSVCEQY